MANSIRWQRWLKSSGVDEDYSNDDVDDGVNDGCNNGSGKGLYYPDDDAFLDDIFDDDYVEKHFSSIPDEKACDRNRNRIMGGPQPPSPNATEEEMKSYERKRKAFTDANRRKLLVLSGNCNILMTWCISRISPGPISLYR